MVRRWLSFSAVIVVCLAFAAYGVIAETGPIGWLNYAQQAVFGAYAKRVSLLVLGLGVEPGWQDGAPVLFIARVDNSNRYLVDAQRGRDSGALLVRTDGAVPVPAAQEFRKMQAPTGEGASLLRLVPSLDGKPRLRDRDRKSVV